MGTGFNLFSSAGVIACSGGSGCMYWGGVAHRCSLRSTSSSVGAGKGCDIMCVGGWYTAAACACRAGVLGFNLV